MHEAVPGPSGCGTVVLDVGPGMGALVLHTTPEMAGREIEISQAGSASSPRTHALVRPRITGSQTRYAAVYPQLPAGSYTVWRDDVTPAATVAVGGGQVTIARWPA